MHSTKSHGKVSGGKDREPAFKEAAIQYTVLTDSQCGTIQ